MATDAGQPRARAIGRGQPRVRLSLTPAGWAVSILLLIDAVVQVGLVAGRVNESNLIRSLVAGTKVSEAEIANSDAFMGALAGAHTILFWIAAIAFLVWIYSANKRAHKLGSQGMRFSPRASVLWFFAPLANLVVPFQAVREIWKASDPGIDRSDPIAWQRAPGSWLIVVWWIGWIGSTLLGRSVPSSLTGEESVQRLIEIGTTAGWLSLAVAVSALLACAVVVLIETRLGAARRLQVLPASPHSEAVVTSTVSTATSRFCGRCGAPRPSGSILCPRCSNPFDDAVGTAATAPKVRSVEDGSFAEMSAGAVTGSGRGSVLRWLGSLLFGVGVLGFLGSQVYLFFATIGLMNAAWGTLGVLALIFFPPLWFFTPFIAWIATGQFPATYVLVWAGGYVVGGGLMSIGSKLRGD